VVPLDITPRQDTTESNDGDAYGMALAVTDRPVDHRATPGGPNAPTSRRSGDRGDTRPAGHIDDELSRLAPGSGREDSAERLDKVPADGRVHGRRPTSRRPSASVGCGKTDV
jgi:hypothetical protein